MDGINKKLNEFLKLHQQKLFKLALLKAADYDVALDIVQETMMAMVKKYRHKTEEEWLVLIYKILNNKVVDWKRKSFFSTLKIIFSNDSLDTVESGQLSMEDELLMNREARQINEKTKDLTQKQKEVIWMKHYGDYTFQEIGKIMSINENSVKTHYYRALEALKKSDVEVCYE